jgi:hypothetical protein
MPTVGTTSKPAYVYDAGSDTWIPIGPGEHTHEHNHDSAYIAKTLVDAKGDILTASAADTPAILTVGANDTVLTADSSTATGLKWATPAAGGMTLISTTTISNQGTVSLTSIPGTYNHLQIVIEDYLPVSNDIVLRMRINSDSGTKYRTMQVDATSMETQLSFSQSSIAVSSFQSQTSSNSLIIIDIPNYANAVTFKTLQSFAITNYPVEGTFILWQSVGVFNSTSAITSLDFFATTGNISSGTIKLYGVK